MARTFANTTGDNLQLAASAITAAPVTLSAWVNLAAVGAVVRTIIDINNSASAQFRNCFRLEMNTTETIQARTGSASASSVSQTAGALTAGTWAHAGAVFASTTSRTAYLNGTAATTETTSRAVTGINQVTIGVESHSSGTLALPWNGGIAEAAVWDAALDVDEMAALAKGFSPLLIRPTSLVYYWPIVGKFSPEIDLISGAGMTVAGTAVAAHPRVFLPKRRQARRFTTSSGVSGAFAAASRRNSLALSGLLSDTATLGATTRRNTLAFAGDVAVPPDGDIAATTRRNTLALSGLVLSTGSFAATSRRNTLAFSGLVSDTATFGATTRRNTLSLVGSASAFGPFAATTRRNRFAASGTSGSIIPTTRRQTIRLRRTAPRGFAN